METSSVVFLLLAILGWGLGAFFDKASLRWMDPSCAFYVRSLLLIVVFAPLVLWKWPVVKQGFIGTARTGSLFVLGSVVTAMAGVFFYLKALSAGEATKIVPLSSTYPVVTFVLAMLFLGESFTANKLVGALLVSAGIFFISK